MPKTKIENLMSRLHQQFGDTTLSPQQQQLMDTMRSHVHNLEEPEQVDPSFLESVELLINDIEEKHPAAATTAKEILMVLNNIGI